MDKKNNRKKEALKISDESPHYDYDEIARFQGRLYPTTENGIFDWEGAD